MIIFVCGTSSTGKSTVCRQLKNKLSDNWLFFSMDGYLGILGDKFLNLHPDNPEVTIHNEVCYAEQHEDGTYEIVPGKLCSKLFSTFPHVLQIIAKQGFSIIVDSLITKKSELDNFKEVLKDFNCLFIYLYAPEENIIQREEERGDRLKGSAIHWFRSFDFKNSCDLRINTDEVNAQDIARQILTSINCSNLYICISLDKGAALSAKELREPAFNNKIMLTSRMISEPRRLSFITLFYDI